jgi:DNA replication protein DnaC
MTTTTDDLRERAMTLGLWGLLAHWDEVSDEEWVLWLIEAEEHERQQRSLQRRLSASRIGVFRAMADFDWKWPEQIDRKLVESLFDFGFLGDATNVVLVGPNGVGKSMIAKNLAHQALMKGHTVRFTTASAMLNDLASQDGTLALQRRLHFYSRPSLLCVDEVGYLSYDTRHADLLFEIVSRRYQQKPILVTTNKPFSEWSEVFPNASCVVALVDRLVHKAEIVQIKAESYRLKEAKQRQAKKPARRSKGPSKPKRKP